MLSFWRTKVRSSYGPSTLGESAPATFEVSRTPFSRSVDGTTITSCAAPAPSSVVCRACTHHTKDQIASCSDPQDVYCLFLLGDHTWEDYGECCSSDGLNDDNPER